MQMPIAESTLSTVLYQLWLQTISFSYSKSYNRPNFLAFQYLLSAYHLITNCFTPYFTSRYLWNQLPSSFRQPHSVHSPPGSPHPANITSSQTSPSFSPSITLSVFHSFTPDLNSFLSQILSSTVILIPPGLPSRILNLYWLSGHWRLFVLVSSFSFSFFSGYVC